MPVTPDTPGFCLGLAKTNCVRQGGPRPKKLPNRALRWFPRTQGLLVLSPPFVFLSSVSKLGRAGAWSIKTVREPNACQEINLVLCELARQIPITPHDFSRTAKKRDQAKGGVKRLTCLLALLPYRYPSRVEQQIGELEWINGSSAHGWLFNICSVSLPSAKLLSLSCELDCKSSFVDNSHFHDRYNNNAVWRIH